MEGNWNSKQTDYSEGQYRNIVRNVLNYGDHIVDRTGVGALCKYGQHISFNYKDYFPIITSKKTFFDKAIVEFCWMINGRTDVKYLHDHGVNFWDSWINDKGNIGKGYGYQARHLMVDQIREIVDGIRKNRYSRRHVFTFWNICDVNEMTLPSCHGTAVIFNATSDGYLNMTTMQRSQDLFLGAPINYVFYGLFLHYVAKLTNLKAGNIEYTIANAHIYTNQIEQAKQMLANDIVECFPKLEISDDIFDYYTENKEIEPRMFNITGYYSNGHIKAPVAV